MKPVIKKRATIPTDPSDHLTRREFLFGGVGSASLLGAAMSTAGCSQLDRWILGDPFDFRQDVVILGGGLAGLSCAWQLRKANRRFRLFEGSNRLGGRVLSLQSFAPDGRPAELGGEWIHQEHSELLELCRELKLPLEERSEMATSNSLWREGKMVEPRDLWAELREMRTRLYLKWSEAQLLGQSAEQWMESAPIGPLAKQWVERFSHLQFSVGTEQVSAQALVQRMLVREGIDPVGGLQRLRFRLRGGTGSLVQALTDRVAGVVFSQSLLLQHQLQRISVYPLGGLRLDFTTPTGPIRVLARELVICLPFTVLRNIEGIDQIELSPEKLNWIRKLRYGSVAKAAMNLERVGSEFLPRGRWSSQQAWWTHLPLAATVEQGSWLVSAQWTGDLAANAGTGLLGQMTQEIREFAPTGKEIRVLPGAQIQNWSKSPWSQGAWSYLGPGDSAAPVVLRMPERNGELLFAGEHVSQDYAGTMQGAVETGLAAGRYHLQNSSRPRGFNL